jgi:mannonate dehydratase
MDRRQFVATATLTAAAAQYRSPVSASDAIGDDPTLKRDSKGAKAGPVRFYAGHQHHSADDDLRMLAALGVRHICGELPSRAFDEKWSVASLVALRKRVESFGIGLSMVPLPLSSSEISQVEFRNIMLGKSPEREREIEHVCQMIRNCAEAGIPAVKYNLSMLGVVRTAATAGRGGSRYSTFVWDKLAKDRPQTIAGAVDEKTIWERITYFLERVVPVAEKAGVRMACHPHDPGIPPGATYRGLPRVLGSVEGLKRFVGIAESKYHGLNFCQGTVSEMLKNPREEIAEVIRYFGSRGKIFNVHFRNIKGGFLNFQETFIDDGDVDMPACLRVYREVGYEGMIMPDHVPGIPIAEGGRIAFAYTFGFINAAIEQVAREV